MFPAKFDKGHPSVVALLSAEKETRDHAEPQTSGPSEQEAALQEALSSLQEEKEAFAAQYQAQVQSAFVSHDCLTFPDITFCGVFPF